jgi:hypothetical protein
MAWQAEIFNIGWSWMLWSLLVGMILFVIGNAAAIFIVLRLPTTYLLDRPRRRLRANRHPALRCAIVFLKNLAGALLIAAGIVLVMPGVPGPGLVALAIGITLLDFPGKHRLERWFIGLPSVLRAINGLRKRFGRPPMISSHANEDGKKND